MTTEEIKQYLSSYYYLSKKVDSLREELRYLEILADGTNSQPFDEPRVQKTPSQKAPFLRYLDKIDAKEKQIDEKLTELLELKDEIQKVISSVDDPVMELVLTYRYINFYDWNDLAKKLHYAESYVFKIHRKALSAIQQKMIVKGSKT